MPLGKTSNERLDTCHPDIQRVIRVAAAGIDRGDLAWAGIHDMCVTCGFRDKAEQDAAYNATPQRSKVPWPRSKHNRIPSDAADVAVYPATWRAPGFGEKMHILHAYITGIARAMGIDMYHIDWDMPHIQRDVP